MLEWFELVGAPGFEPGASSTQNLRATKLRYAPTTLLLTQRMGFGQRYMPQDFNKLCAGRRYNAVCKSFIAG